jgi:hypothetical protein
MTNRLLVWGSTRLGQTLVAKDKKLGSEECRYLTFCIEKTRKIPTASFGERHTIQRGRVASLDSSSCKQYGLG